MENSNFSELLLDTKVRSRGSTRNVIASLSYVVATVAAAVALLVSFTELTFTSLTVAELTPTLAVMLVCSYLMYFSLEAAGEEAGAATEEYKTATERFKAAKERVAPGMIEALRVYCNEYTRRELEYRRTSYLISSGYSLDEYEAYRAGGKVDRRARRVFRKYGRMCQSTITPAILLGGERVSKTGELDNPEQKKLLILTAKLIPTTVCMIFTASVVLSVKGGLTPESVIETLLKLSTLPMVAFRGYTCGYSYAKERGVEWTLTRTRLIESFLEST